jgi:hypothetical protein
MKEFLEKIINKDSSLITGAVALGIVCLIFPPDQSNEKIIWTIITGLFTMTGNHKK